MFTYKPWLIGESGFSLRVAYQLNYAFRIQIRSFTYKPRGFLPGTYGIYTHTHQKKINTLGFVDGRYSYKSLDDHIIVCR